MLADPRSWRPAALPQPPDARVELVFSSILCDASSPIHVQRRQAPLFHSVARHAARATQSFKAARVSPEGACDAARAPAFEATRLLDPAVAPRMNSTAQAAHIAQMPNTTSHFSISPVLKNPVSFFACPQAARYVSITARRII
jgi:hypothetical protein